MREKQNFLKCIYSKWNEIFDLNYITCMIVFLAIILITLIVLLSVTNGVFYIENGNLNGVKNFNDVTIDYDENNVPFLSDKYECLKDNSGKVVGVLSNDEINVSSLSRYKIANKYYFVFNVKDFEDNNICMKIEMVAVENEGSSIRITKPIGEQTVYSAEILNDLTKYYNGNWIKKAAVCSNYIFDYYTLKLNQHLTTKKICFIIV